MPANFAGISFYSRLASPQVFSTVAALNYLLPILHKEAPRKIFGGRCLFRFFTGF